LLQSLHKRRKPGLSFWIVCGHIHQHTDAPHALAGLPAHRERPRRRRASERG
jgi:hypothetical protein